jgi:hypothetical protein
VIHRPIPLIFHPITGTVGSMASRKLSLVIDDAAAAVIDPYLTPGTPQREAAGLLPDASDAAILRELLVRGAAELERERMAAWYEEFARDYGDLAVELADESTALMNEVLAAEQHGAAA